MSVEPKPGQSQCAFCERFYYTHSARKGTETEQKLHSSGKCRTAAKAVTQPSRKPEMLWEAKRWDSTKKQILESNPELTDYEAAKLAWETYRKVS